MLTIQSKIIVYLFILIASINLPTKLHCQIKVNRNFTNIQNKDLFNSYNLNFFYQSIDSLKSGSSYSLFLDIGLGRAPKIFEGKGTSAGIFIYFSVNKNTFSLRSLGNMEYFLKAGPEPVEVYSDLSLLLGYKLFSDKNQSIIPMIGAGKVTSIKRGKLLDELSVNAKCEKLKESTIGMSLGIKFQVNTEYTAYSLYVFSNVNSIQSYYGILFCFGLGKFIKN